MVWAPVMERECSGKACVCERDSVCDSWANATGRHPRLPLQPTVASAVRLQAHVWLAVYRARGQSLSEASASRGRLRSCLLHPQGYMAQSMSEQATESKSDARTRDGEGGAQGPPVSPARSPRARARAGGGSRAAVPSGFPSLGVSTSHIPSGVQYSKSSPMGAAGVLCGEGRWLQKSAARLQRSVGNSRLPVWLDFVL